MLSEATLIVDGLFGTGLNRALEGEWATLVQTINESNAPCVSLDLPSGIDANTGQVLGVAVRAAATVTFAGHKRGLHQFPGAEYAGHVVLADIGVPPLDENDAWLLRREDLHSFLPTRRNDAHKGMAGHTVIVGGSPGKNRSASTCWARRVSCRSRVGHACRTLRYPSGTRRKSR